MSRFEKIISLISVGLLVVLLAFVSGFVYRHLSIWPTGGVLALYRQVTAWLEHGVWGGEGAFLPADVTEGAPRAEVHKPEDFLPGYRMIMAYDSDLGIYSIRMLDSAAEQVHVWRTDYYAIRPEHNIRPGLSPHGMEILPDGSVVVNFDLEAEAMARLDACSVPMWKRDGKFHHSVHLGEDGLLWTWEREGGYREKQYENIVALDVDTGETLREFRIEDIAAASRKNAIALTLPEDFEFRPAKDVPKGVAVDLHHPNDVEPLTTELAPAFPGFEAGDLLISLRDTNYVGVLDPDTLDLKWGLHGPWIRQHDPDFTADGWIDIYNNNEGRGRSDIVSVNPTTGAFRRVFTSEDSYFSSRVQGKQQKLPNGNYLITVPLEGRVIELNSAGEMVFEYNNIVKDGLNGRTLNAFWVPEDFYAAPPSCATNG
jgi:hypothetical protein